MSAILPVEQESKPLEAGDWVEVVRAPHPDSGAKFGIRLGGVYRCVGVGGMFASVETGKGVSEWFLDRFKRVPPPPPVILPAKKESAFVRIASEVGALVAEKNEAYGDSFAKCGDFLRLLFPAGIPPERYGDALALVRVFDKQMRIATRKEAFGESPFRDIAGYGILGAAKDEAKP